jgi:peptidyl-dipeptidase Dcp
MPAELVDRIKRSRTFNQGFALTEYVSAALLDMAWHLQRPGRSIGGGDIDAFERDVLREHGLAVPEIPPRYHSTYFAHAWNGGYGAGYYAYLWAEVLDHDAYDWFQTHGGLSREALCFRARLRRRARNRRIPLRDLPGISSAETRASSRCWRSADSPRPRCDRRE